MAEPEKTIKNEVTADAISETKEDREQVITNKESDATSDAKPDADKQITNAESDATSDAMEEEETVINARLTADMLSNPEMLSAIQTHLGTMIGLPSGYIENLPTSVKRRIKALKKMQVECVRLESKFYEEIHALECKFAELYAPYYDKRHQITSGIIEPTDEECDFPSDSENEVEDDSKDTNKTTEDKKDAKEADNEGADVKGIPEFWLTVLKNVDMIAEQIQEYDEPILKHLTDIKVQFKVSPMSYTLEFHFERNTFFSNAVLTKEYEMRCIPEECDPFSFEGPEVYKCKGCPIEWNKNQNVTVKTIKKKQKNKSKGSVRTITKTVQSDSFFNFFNPPAVPEGDEQLLDEEQQAILTADFEMGHFIRERLVPQAVLFFTGEALSDEELDEDEDEDEEEEDEDDKGEDEEEKDPDFTPALPKAKAAKGLHKGQPQPQDCKQQ